MTDGWRECPACKGVGERYAFARSINPFSGVAVNDQQCVEPSVCGVCWGDGVLPAFDNRREAA